jgi:hypothetical protein
MKKETKPISNYLFHFMKYITKQHTKKIQTKEFKERPTKEHFKNIQQKGNKTKLQNVPTERYLYSGKY